MTREELIKYCRYYKGEEECPFEQNTNKSTFWGIESVYVSKYTRPGWEHGIESWERKAQNYIKEYPNANNILTSIDVSIHTKGIAVYIDCMCHKWCPYDVGMALEY